MTIAYWCLLTAIIFPYIFCALAKWSPGFDNHTPREYLERLKGWRKRAHWVQLNSFEILPSFAAAVIIAHQYSPHISIINYLALGFIAMRFLYAVCYIADKALLRTVCWVLSFGFVLAIFLFATLYSPYGKRTMTNLDKQSHFCQDGIHKKDKFKRGIHKKPHGMQPNEKTDKGMRHPNDRGVMKPNGGDPGMINPGYNKPSTMPKGNAS